jgi:cytochrome c oxidase assembly factor CtaG
MLLRLLLSTVLLDRSLRRSLPRWRSLGTALALLAASGVLANTLVLSYRPLYPSYTDTAGRPLGLSPVGDQDLAALVMMLEQLATLGTFAFLSARQQLAAADLEQPQRHPLAA